MLGGVGEALRAVAAAVAMIALAWVAGSALRPTTPPAERLMTGLCVVLGLAWLLMAQPLVGVSVLAHRWPLRVVVVAAAAAAVVLRRPALPAIDWRRVALPAVAAALVSMPVWLAPGGAYPGSDILWHEGWIHQLTGGMPAPGGIYAHVPNAYPWLEHSLAALIVSLFGIDVAAALGAVEYLMLLVLGLGTFLLARSLRLGERAAGWSSALAIGGGGVGWLLAGGPAALLSVAHYGNATTPPGLRPYVQGLDAYGGDLLLSPAPTPALGNVPPALPRELGLVLLPVVLWLAIGAAGERSPRRAAAAGAVAGLATLASPVAGLEAGVGVIAVAAAYRSRTVLWAALGAAPVAAMWVVPLLRDAHRLGGFVNTTRAAPISLTASQAAVTLATLLVLGAAGLALLARGRPRPDWRGLSAVAAAAIVPLAASGAPGGAVARTIPALSRGIHYLPAVALALALPAGVAAAAAAARAGRLRVVAGAGIAAACLLSSATASAGMVSVLELRNDHPLLACSGRLPYGADDTVALIPARAVPGADLESLGVTVFAATGSAELYIPRPRIRFRRIFGHIPNQGARTAALDAIAAGGPLPDDVTGVLAPSGMRLSPGLRGADSCTVQTFMDGRWWSQRYTAYVRGAST